MEEGQPAKSAHARCMLRSYPEKWFGGMAVDARDRALLDGEFLSWVDYTKGSFVRKIWSQKKGKQFEQIVESDEKCKKLVKAAGGQLIGFDFPQGPPEELMMPSVKVNITGSKTSGFAWGYLATLPENIRIFKGPPETCALHLRDVMILRDCVVNTDSLYDIPALASRKWDVLAMKMCEDYDHPWMVCVVKDVDERHPEACCCNGH